jgi:hypothetical protein
VSGCVDRARPPSAGTAPIQFYLARNYRKIVHKLIKDLRIAVPRGVIALEGRVRRTAAAREHGVTPYEAQPKHQA